MDKNIDKKLIRKIMTYKSGQFVFSYKYDNNSLSQYIISAYVLNETIRDIPILPDLAATLDEELMIRSIFSTAAIEGNPLSEAEVSKIVLDKEKAITDRQQEISNLKIVYNKINSMEMIYNKKINLSEKTIKEIQKDISSNINYEDNIPGKYRTHPVKVGDKGHGGIYVPPKIKKDIENLMSEFIKWFNNDLPENCYVKAALAHLYLGLIHPFGQGNGRTARAIEGMILQISGVKYLPKMLSNYYYKNIDDYYWAFSNTIKSLKNKEYDVTPFLDFVFKGINESFVDLKNRIFNAIKIVTLKDYYNCLLHHKYINSRQSILLNFLIINNIKFSINDLLNADIFKPIYKKLTERTARRDIKNLCNQKLLISEKDGKFFLNTEALSR